MWSSAVIVMYWIEIRVRLALVILLVSLYYIDSVIFVGALQNVETATNSGKIAGTRVQLEYSIGEDMLTNTVDEWLGVPYGKADRWQVSPYPPPWDGVRDCSKLGPVCPQVTYYSHTETEYQGEDCLVLNVYSPLEAGSEHELYPVMVFIHGGSYEEGSGNRYDGKALASLGVVVVTINYRLGELGYMTTGDDTLPGNYGLQDQILAIKWVGLNIERFRGNSSCVTIFGNSAGASSVGILMTTPETEGLFHRAVIQSGSPLSYWAIHSPDVDHGQVVRDVASSVGCNRDNLKADVDCMRTEDYNKMLDMHFEVEGTSPSRLLYKPLVGDSVLQQFPEESFKTGMYHHVDVMIGVVSNEWARNAGWFYTELDDHKIDKYLDDGLDRDSFVKAIHHVVQERFGWPVYIADVLMQFYTNTSFPDDVYANRQSYLTMMSDVSMFSPSIRLASLLSTHQRSVYFYEFDHHSEHTDPQWWGSYHALELDYVFGSPYSGYNIAWDGYRIHSQEEKELSRKVMKLWTDFAKYGNPTTNLAEKNSIGLQALDYTLTTDEKDQTAPVWQPYDNFNQFYLYISTKDIVLRQRFRETEVFFWNTIIPRLLQSTWQPHSHSGDGSHGLIVWVFAGLFGVTILLLCIVGLKYSALHKKMVTMKKLYHPTTASV